jgi:hypothetical protein
VVQEVIDWLVERYSATVEVRTTREESVHFPLPKVLRSLAKREG